MKVAFHDMDRCVTIIAFVVIYGRIGFFTPLFDRGGESATFCSPLWFSVLFTNASSQKSHFHASGKKRMKT
jgi:hypothetical protein